MPPDTATRTAALWLAKARGDLRAVEILTAAIDAPLDVIAFHAQQIAEKALKARLAAMGVPLPRTHDLEELARMLPQDTPLGGSADDLALLSQLAGAGAAGAGARYHGDRDAKRTSVVERYPCPVNKSSATAPPTSCRRRAARRWRCAIGKEIAVRTRAQAQPIEGAVDNRG